ncbi:hypothetical protein [Sphingomonas paucimobilis]|uniref:hypothetical protein n=1 Tax=Sphingomonas paucimobilis TaxID=13689 RepID=UPI0028D58C90|nr:hypothetical protein [Sphingomonas paucimobilis]
MILLTLLLQSQFTLPIPVENGQTVVVTADSLTQTKKALDDCLAHQCPPKEDIARSLAYAEMQFLTGNYEGSYRTLLSSRGRNSRYDSVLPKEVADLHRATSRLARLNGVPINPRVNAADAVYALRAGLPANDPAILAQRLEVGDELAREGRAEGAFQHYDWVAREADKIGDFNLVGQSYLRAAVLQSALGSLFPEYRTRARDMAERILKRPEPEMLPYRNAARAIQIQLADEKDRAAIADRVIAEMEPGQTGRQMLVFSPSIRQEELHFGSAPGQEKANFVDFSYRITPDGHVVDITPQNISDRIPAQWIDVISQKLALRRYTPRNDSDPRKGQRLERFSIISPQVTYKGSRMRSRASTWEINTFDLTADSTS